MDILARVSIILGKQLTCTSTVLHCTINISPLSGFPLPELACTPFGEILDCILIYVGSLVTAERGGGEMKATFIANLIASSLLS